MRNVWQLGYLHCLNAQYLKVEGASLEEIEEAIELDPHLVFFVCSIDLFGDSNLEH